MLKKTVKYKNYFGVEKERTLYFDLTKSELMTMSLSTEGGLENVLENILETEDMPAIIKNFEEILLKSYGEKSEDGERFMKGDDISRKFKESPVYDAIFMELITDEKKAADFINAVFPKDLDEYVEKTLQKQSGQTVDNQVLQSAT